MIIKNKPSDIQLTLYNGGRLRIRVDNPNFNVKNSIKTLNELIPLHQKHMESSSKKDFSMEELNIQLMKLLETRQTLINLLEEN